MYTACLNFKYFKIIPIPHVD